MESFRVADNAQRKQLDEIMAMPLEQGEEKIARMQQMYSTLGIKEGAAKAINGYYESALEKIARVNFNNSQLEQLHNFANKLIKRIK